MICHKSGRYIWNYIMFYGIGRYSGIVLYEQRSKKAGSQEMENQ